MKLLLLSFLFGVFSFQAKAESPQEVNSNPMAGVAMVLALNSPEASVEAKQLISSLLNGQEYELRTSVMDVTVGSSTGRALVSITIGQDDLTDGDEGWSNVYRLDIVIQADAAGNPIVVGVNLVPLAG